MKANKKIKNYGNLWIKIRDVVRLISENSDDYNEKYIIINI